MKGGGQGVIIGITNVDSFDGLFQSPIIILCHPTQLLMFIFHFFFNVPFQNCNKKRISTRQTLLTVLPVPLTKNKLFSSPKTRTRKVSKRPSCPRSTVIMSNPVTSFLF